MGATGRNVGKEERRTFTKITLTSLSAAVAETATFPIDIIKTRLQLQGGDFLHRSPTEAGSAPRIAVGIWRTGGVFGFYGGLAPAVLRHVFYTPIRIVSYENLRNLAGDSLAGRAFAGGVSGAVAQVIFLHLSQSCVNLKWGCS